MPTDLAFKEARRPEPFPEYMARFVRTSPDFLSGVRTGIAALKEGRITPWEDVERELGLG